MLDGLISLAPGRFMNMHRRFIMNNKERAPSQVGIFNIPRSAAHPDDKVLKVFNKLKQMETNSSSPSGQVEPNVEELRRSAMNS
jgi:hypothetical protein